MLAGIKAGKTGNMLLDRLESADVKRLAGALKTVEIPARRIVYEYNDPVDYVYFPVTSLLTLIIGEPLAGGRSLEFTSVGKEGMVGFPALFGAPRSLHKVACHAGGVCLRLPTSVLAGVMARRKRVD